MNSEIWKGRSIDSERKREKNQECAGPDKIEKKLNISKAMSSAFKSTISKFIYTSSGN